MKTKQTKTTGAKQHLRPDGTWNIDAMTSADFDALAAECETIAPGSGRALTKKERVRFEAWQKRALAEEPTEKKNSQSVTLVFPTKLTTQIGELAKAKRTTPEHLLQRIVQNAIHQAVA